MSFLGELKKSVKRYFTNITAIKSQLELLTDINLELLINERKKTVKNPFNNYGKKVFSQNDEDGLILEIIQRIGIDKQTSYFAEFGIGDGSECNTLMLAMLGYKGIWAGNEELIVDAQKSNKVKYLKTWITLDNICGLIDKGMELHGIKNKEQFKIISVDLDGNDYYLTREILKSYKPDLFIVEYNALFPPPIEFCIDYNPDHTWENSDNYFGCSLSTYDILFESNGYFLVCCNLFTGANAFYVKKEYRDKFPEVPNGIEQKFVPPFYIAGNRRIYHKSSVKTINQILR